MLHINTYTLEASESIDDLVEMDAAEIWADLAPQPQDTVSDLWRRKLEKLSQEYRLSSRFALARILHNRVYSACRTAGAGLYPPGSDPSGWTEDICASEQHFKMVLGRQSVLFRDISMEHIMALSAQEHDAYLTCLLEMAQRSEDADPAADAALISRAWHIENTNQTAEEKGIKVRDKKEKEARQRCAAPLSREEALQLGHILGFRFSEMEWYLLRVFDSSDAFRMNRSGDLIHAYCFFLERSWKHAQWLREEFARRTDRIPKIDNEARRQSWTAQLSGDFAHQISVWKTHPDDCDEQFLSWLTSRAAGLDVPGYTVRYVYQNLAAYAYGLMTGKIPVPEESQILDILQKLCSCSGPSPEAVRCLYRENIPAPDLCRDIAKALLRDNKERSSSLRPDNTDAWSVPTIRKDGALSASYGVVNESRTRIQSLLAGQAQVEKGDMLYLLWYTLNIIWYGANQPDADTLYCRILDLKDASHLILQAAGLAPFYPAHLLEYTMLLSIICAGKEAYTPTEVYEQVLQSLKQSRDRKAGSKKHGLPEKIQIVTSYIHSDMTLEQCAAVHHISPKTLSSWQQELLEKGLVSK